MKKINRYLFAALCVAFGPSLLAADEFALRVPPAHFGGIASRNGLTLVSRIEQQNYYLVLGPGGVPAAEVIRRVKQDARLNVPGRGSVVIEANRSLPVAEIDGTASLNASPAPVNQALTVNRSLIDFYGNLAWAGFVRQPAAQLVRSGATHRDFGTGRVVVAVIDSGVDPDHTMLKHWLVPGYDFTRNRPGASEWVDLDPETQAIMNPSTTAILDGDGVVLNPSTTAILDANTASRLNPSRIPASFGHGTMVAGLIRLGAPGAYIMPLKVFDSAGRATLFNVIRAIYYAHANGAKVINMSLSVREESEMLEDAIEDVEGENVICVSSAGNSGTNTEVYPAAHDEVLGTAATTNLDRRATFSNFGEEAVSIAAPGEAMITLYPGNRYAAGWGTSFSAPLTAAAAAIMAEARPAIASEEVRGAMRKFAKRIAEAGGRRLDFYESVKAIVYRLDLSEEEQEDEDEDDDDDDGQVVEPPL